jgi:hypothetical protein
MDAQDNINIGAAPYTRAEKFRYLAEHRVSTLLRRLQSIGSLSRRSSYDYTDEEVVKIFDAIRNAVDQAEAKFSGEQKNNFRF